MLLPENQDFGFVFGFFGKHICPPYRVFIEVERAVERATDTIEKLFDLHKTAGPFGIHMFLNLCSLKM